MLYLLVFFVYLVIYTFNICPIITNSVNIASIAGAVVALYALIWQLHTAIKANKILASLELNTSVNGTYVTISCSITNVGTKSIYPYLTNLYVSEGIEKDENNIKRYIFEAITEHQINRNTGECFDCEIAEHCKKERIDETTGKITFPPCKEDSPFKNKLRYCCNLRQLSYFTLVHIMSKETFREDVVLKIPTPGVYRAFVIYTGKEWDDCICSTAIFRIE